MGCGTASGPEFQNRTRTCATRGCDTAELPVPVLHPIDDASIVTEEPKVLARLTKREDSKDEELEANCFGPPNVPSFCVPTRDESPGPPTVGDDNCDSNSGAGIRERAIVFDVTRTRDSARKFLGAEGADPP